MTPENQKHIDGILNLINEAKISQKLDKIYYREDYEDYQLFFGDTHHCEIQEKFINDVIVFNNGDSKRQILFLLKHLTAWPDGERPSQLEEFMNSGDQDDKITLEDET